MKIPTFIFTAFFILSGLILKAQNPVITPDVSQGCDTLTVKFSYSSPLVSPSVLWRFGDGTTSNIDSPVKKYTRPGSYTVFLKLNGTDSTTMPDLIKVGRTPDIDSLGLQINLRDTTGSGKINKVIEVNYNNNHPFPYAYQWSVEGVSVSINKRFVQPFDTAGLYHLALKMTDQVGCTATINGSFKVLADLFVPNIFTPNGDHENDDFKIESDGQEVISLSIFTRSGLLIYKSQGKTIFWDGRLPSGEKVLPGIYYYVVEIVNGPTSRNKTGFVYILY